MEVKAGLLQIWREGVHHTGVSFNSLTAMVSYMRPIVF
jgi:hypothetical protein